MRSGLVGDIYDSVVSIVRLAQVYDNFASSSFPIASNTEISNNWSFPSRISLGGRPKFFIIFNRLRVTSLVMLDSTRETYPINSWPASDLNDPRCWYKNTLHVCQLHLQDRSCSSDKIDEKGLRLLFLWQTSWKWSSRPQMIEARKVRRMYCGHYWLSLPCLKGCRVKLFQILQQNG